MTATKTLLAGAAISFLAGAAGAQPIGDGLVMYMQMGGNPGDGATLARHCARTTAGFCVWLRRAIVGLIATAIVRHIQVLCVVALV